MNNPYSTWPLRSIGLALSLFVFLTSGLQAETDAPDNAVNSKRFVVYLGGFYPEVNSDVRLDADIFGGIGDTISLEDTLGLEEGKAVLWGGLVWHMSRRNFLEFEYFQLNRSGSVGALTEAFQIGDSVVQVGARSDTTVDVDIGRITYGFYFVDKEKLDVAVKGGIHWLELDAGITLSGAVSNVETGEQIQGSVTEGGSIGAPLPHVGLSLNYAITPKVVTRAQALLFGAGVEQYSGFLLDLGFDFIYSPFKHFGFGGGLRYFDLRLKADDGKFSGEFDYGYWGPTLFLVGKF